MTPPISIDGTDITGATIDGTDVQEITVDGDTVFTSGPQINNFPVAYSDLVAWYPFDSATYGGSNADDVTAILGGSGDDTAYDGTVFGATYQSSGGVTDINGGANSGGFDFSGGGDVRIENQSINTPSYFGTFDWTISFVFNADTSNGDGILFQMADRPPGDTRVGIRYRGGENILAQTTDDGFSSRAQLDSGTTYSTGQFVHVVFTKDNAGNHSLYAREEGFSGNTLVDTDSYALDLNVDFIFIGAEIIQSNIILNEFDGIIDDVRVYKKELSSNEIDTIYNNIMP